MSDETLPAPVPNGNPHCITYFVQAATGGAIKIGKTIDINSRLNGLQTGSPLKLVCLGQIQGDCEEQLHERFAADRLHGEWFSPTKALCKFIEKNAAPAEMPKPGKMHRDTERQLMIGRWERECEGKWLDADEQFEDRLSDLIDFPPDTCPEDNAEDNADEPVELIDGHIPDCECDKCTWLFQAVPQLVGIEMMGAVWREEDWMLCVYVPRPGSPGVVVRQLASTSIAFSETPTLIHVVHDEREAVFRFLTEGAELFAHFYTVLRPEIAATVCPTVNKTSQSPTSLRSTG